MAIEFRFKAGKAFLDKHRHPITVPRNQVNYSLLEQELQNTNNELTIICPSGEKLSGYLLSATAGFWLLLPNRDARFQKRSFVSTKER